MWCGPPMPQHPIKIDRMISLGGACEVAAQLRRLAADDTAYPFDWWITPLQSVKKIIDDRCNSLFLPESIVKTSYNNKQCFYSSWSETVHMHDFNNYDLIGELSVGAISDYLTEKYKFLFGRMSKLCSSGTTLFVRKALPADNCLPAADLDRALNSIYDALAQIAPAYYFVVIGYEVECTLPCHILRECVADEDDWAASMGSSRGWTSCFERLPFEIARNRGFGVKDLFFQSN
jgi:hypothetical protein